MASGGLVEKSHPPLNLTDLNLQVLAKHFDAAIVLTDERGNILISAVRPANTWITRPARLISIC